MFVSWFCLVLSNLNSMFFERVVDCQMPRNFLVQLTTATHLALFWRSIYLLDGLKAAKVLPRGPKNFCLGASRAENLPFSQKLAGGGFWRLWMGLPLTNTRSIFGF